MEPTELLESIDKGMKGFAATLEASVAEIPAVIKKAMEPDEVLTAAQAAEAATKETADVEQLGGIMDMEVWDVPVGKALVGGFIAVVGSELIDGFLANRGVTVTGVAKLVGAGVAVKWGRRFLGKPGAAAVAILLAYDGLRDLVPIDQWGHRLASGVSGVVTTRGLGGNTVSAAGGANDGAGRVRGGIGYYDALKGR